MFDWLRRNTPNKVQVVGEMHPESLSKEEAAEVYSALRWKISKKTKILFIERSEKTMSNHDIVAQARNEGKIVVPLDDFAKSITPIGRIMANIFGQMSSSQNPEKLTESATFEESYAKLKTLAENKNSLVFGQREEDFAHLIAKTRRRKEDAAKLSFLLDENSKERWVDYKRRLGNLKGGTTAIVGDDHTTSPKSIFLAALRKEGQSAKVKHAISDSAQGKIDPKITRLIKKAEKMEKQAEKMQSKSKAWEDQPLRIKLR